MGEPSDPFGPTLTCPICCDIITFPVLLTTCGHSFCSHCVRQSLSTSKSNTCPVCFVPSDPARICINVTLEGVLAAYRQLKESKFFEDRLKTSAGNARPSTSNSKTATKRKQLSQESTDSDIEIVSVSKLNRREATPDTSLAKQWNTLFSGTASKPKVEITGLTPGKHLPSLSYNNMKLADLKLKLKNMGVPVTTPHQVDTLEYLIRRHKQFVLLWNSSCDGIHLKEKLKKETISEPVHKTVENILEKLRRWEKTMDSNESKKKKEPLNMQSHYSKYKDHFRELEQEIRDRGRKSSSEVSSEVVDLT